MTGGHDGIVNFWTVQGAALTKSNSIDLKLPAINSMNPAVTAVCLGAQSSILIGTRGGEIVEVKGGT